LHTIFEVLSVLHYTSIACNRTKITKNFTNWILPIWKSSSALGVEKLAKCQNAKDLRAEIMGLCHNILIYSPHTNKRFLYGATTSIRPGPLQCPGITITLRHTTLSRTPLKRLIGPSQRPLPTNTQHSKETDICPVGIQTTVPGS